MSLQTSGSSNLLRSSGLPAGEFTYAGWLLLQEASFTAGAGLHTSNGGGSGSGHWTAVYTQNEDGQTRAFVARNSFGTFDDAAVGPDATWVYAFIVWDGSSVLSVYSRYEGETSLSLVVSITGNTAPATAAYIFGSENSEFATSGSRASMVRMWSAALTPTEGQAESESTTPVRTTNLYSNVSCAVGSTIGQDTSGNGNNYTLTNSGGLSLNADEPDISAGSVSGTLASAAPSQGAAIAGAVPRSATVASSSPAQGSAATGAVPRTGGLAAGAPAQVSAIAGGLVATGSLASSSPPQAAAIGGIVPRTGTASTTAPAQASALAGSVPRTGSLAATAATQASSLLGSGVTIGALASVAPAQTGALAGAVPRTGTLVSVVRAQVSSILTPLTGILDSVRDAGSSLWRRFGHHRR